MINNTEKVLVLRVAVPSPLRNLFDYLLPKNCEHKNIKPGVRVLVPFGRRELIGVVLEVATHSDFNAKLKPVLEILDDNPLLSEKVLELINWTSSYYHHPIGDVINNALPKLLRQKNRKKKDQQIYPDFKGSENIAKKPLQLNEYQKRAITDIRDSLNKFKTFLLDGVTGSGKTEVYLRVIEEVIALNKQALILIPEINLTPQTIERFAERFSVRIAVFHSRLTPKERLLSWQMAKDGIAPIIIGTRSAIFTPLKNPGIIIVDEEHDLSFKQQTGLRYSARD
ncbi:MAG: DEAD/DEAH box helicase family protein, partial [Gammaproteobacteria bacterium]|nr:DEAD/DEAH box helicase family protein [Gammaproteobacteria bacterium]